MRREVIHAVAQWRKGVSRYDTVLIKLNNGESGMRAFSVGRLRLLFSFRYFMSTYICALVDDFHVVDDGPDLDTGMWKVKKAFHLRSRRRLSRVICLTDILRAVHLIPIFKVTVTGRQVMLPEKSSPDTALDDYQLFYVNKYIDHHMFEILS